MSEERRRARRDLITVPLNFTYSYKDSEQKEKSATTNGISLNVSPRGMCFYTHLMLGEGTELTLSSKAIWDVPKKGIVRWCRKITEELYRVGLELD
jgi:hypothetical protein